MDHYDVKYIEDITYGHTGRLNGTGDVLATPQEEFDDTRDDLKLDLYLPVTAKDRKGNRQSRGGEHGRHMRRTEGRAITSNPVDTSRNNNVIITPKLQRRFWRDYDVITPWLIMTLLRHVSI